MSLAKRSLTSASWTVIASTSNVIILFGRSIILARLLPVEIFGLYAAASALIRLTVVVPSFGLGGAFLHRAPETQDESETAAVHFTLKTLFTILWMAVMALVAATAQDADTRLAMLVLTLSIGGLQITQTPRLILSRRVVHRRLAVLDTLNALLTSLAAIWLALRGETLWALLATDLVSASLAILILYVWRPVWRPRLAWSGATVRYFIRFGAKNFTADLLLRALDKVDDLWTVYFLGQEPLGFYSRAYNFATYPRQILASPINSVAGGTYAELKGDHLGLSKAFFRTNAFLIRSGFLLAGALALVAPEFIRLLLGAKWLPMLTAFRLMLVFTLLDPIKVTVANLFIAVGQPEVVVRARVVQLAVLLAGLAALSPFFGIAGIAVAVDLMLVVGIALQLYLARAHVNFSARRLFSVPLLALVVGMTLGRGGLLFPGVLGSPWRTGAMKLALFIPVYIGVLLLLERQETIKMLSRLRSSIRGSPRAAQTLEDSDDISRHP